MWGTIIAATGLAVSLFGSIVTLAYHLGKVMARVESLEQWRGEMQHTLDRIYSEIRSVKTFIKNGED